MFGIVVEQGSAVIHDKTERDYAVPDTPGADSVKADAHCAADES